MKETYTYLWLREDGTPYYVGKGTKKRAHTKHRVGKAPIGRVLLQEHPTEGDALAAERFFIMYYGREDQGKGTLLNLTDGGENPPIAWGNKTNKGRIPTPEALVKRSRALKQAWAEGRHSGMKGKTHSEETKQKMSFSSHRAACGNRFRGKPWSEARRTACASS